MEASASRLTAPTWDQFAKSSVESGLLTAADVRRAAAALPADKRNDPRTVAQALVKQQKLTSYQANRLLSGSGTGLVLGQYVILDQLGEGGMGVVYKARHRALNKVVALKVLAPEVTGQEVALKRFRREVRTASKLSHPNIVAALDAGEEQGTHFLVLEYVQGSDLARWVKEHGPMPLAQAVACALGAARGLAYAHAAGIVHRDIKPANLFFDASKTTKVLDLGLARIDKTGQGRANQTVLEELTQTGSIMGTCDYMAPEQALKRRSAGTQSRWSRRLRVASASRSADAG